MYFIHCILSKYRLNEKHLPVNVASLMISGHRASKDIKSSHGLFEARVVKFHFLLKTRYSVTSVGSARGSCRPGFTDILAGDCGHLNPIHRALDDRSHAQHDPADASQR